MIDDFRFRNLVIQRKYDEFVQAANAADFTPSQKDALGKFARYVIELDRVIRKEEGCIVYKM